MVPGCAQPSDGTLLAEFASSGQEAPFEEIVRRHGGLVMGVCLRILGDRDRAEDAVQAVFVTLAHKAGSLGGRASAAGWLHHVARHVALRARESELLRRAREQEAGKMTHQTDDAGRQQASFRLLLDAEMDALPEKYRVPLILHHIKGESEEDCAGLLGCKTGTVSARLSRGRELLRQRLARRGLALSVGLLAALLVGEAAGVEVPAAVAAASVRSAALAAAGKAAAAGGLLGSLSGGGLKFLAAALLGAAVLGVGAGLATHGLGAAGGPAPVRGQEPRPPAAAASAPGPQEPAGPEHVGPPAEPVTVDADAEARAAEVIRLAREVLAKVKPKCRKSVPKACRRLREYSLQLAGLGRMAEARELMGEAERLERALGGGKARPAGTAEVPETF